MTRIITAHPELGKLAGVYAVHPEPVEGITPLTACCSFVGCVRPKAVTQQLLAPPLTATGMLRTKGWTLVAI